MGLSLADWIEVLSGVPQGSVLGPLLFIIFINDLPERLHHICQIYADDSKVLAVLNEFEINNNKLQDDIYKLEKWCSDWSMKLNAKKCKIMHIGKKNPRREYHMFDSTSNSNIILETTEIERDLGVLVSSDGSFSHQVNAAIARANSILGRMRNTFKYFNSNILKTLYLTFIRPHLEFASPVWNALLRQDLDKIEKFQRKVTRYATDLSGLNYQERLKRFKITTIKERRIRGDLIQYYKIKNGLDSINFIKQAKILKSKRPHSQKIDREAFNNCTYRHNFLTNRISTNWNRLPSKVVESKSLNSFKASLDGHMSSEYFKNLQNLHQD